MTASKAAEQAEDMVQCATCQVWIRRDRLEQHARRAHSPKAAPKKSFTTYTARIVSSFPPKVINKANASRPVGAMTGTITLISRRGQRAGRGACAECGVETEHLWHYAESDHGPVDICSNCKTKVFERSFGTTL